jgi:hypothetical protein
MYWCCGKTAKDAPGCKANKHESKEEEDDDELEKEKKEREKERLLNAKCFSCKDFGHDPYECEKDPNLRTGFTEYEELGRV